MEISQDEVLIFVGRQALRIAQLQQQVAQLMAVLQERTGAPDGPQASTSPTEAEASATDSA